MKLLLLHTRPDPVALTQWATRRNWLSPDGDFGYALHTLLADAFGSKTPAPFCYMDEQGLLAYTEDPEQALRERITRASPDVQRTLGLDTFRIRTFPVEWQVGKLLNFEVRIRPIIRTNKGRERDLYQYRMERWAEDGQDKKPSREATYKDWLDEKLATENAARLLNASMQGFSLSRVIRRSQGESASQRKTQLINGPDVRFTGTLEVTDTNAFARLIARGIGRHRAFGYGMLLLKPTHRR